MSFNSNNKSGPGPIPKRWLKCPRRSDTFVMQRFMVTKNIFKRKSVFFIPISINRHLKLHSAQNLILKFPTNLCLRRLCSSS